MRHPSHRPSIPRALLALALLIAVSLVVCITAFLLLAGHVEVGRPLLRNFLISFPPALALGLLNYWLISRLSRIRRLGRWRIGLDWLLTSALGLSLSLLLRRLVGGADTSSLLEVGLPFLVWNSMVVFGLEAAFYYRQALARETLLARAEKEKATYQYEALKNQMNPHFLFNSLNVLASLAYQDAAKTNLFAKKLSAVYRYLLTTYERPLVTLDEEMEFLRSYLFLEEIRFGKAVQVNLSIEETARRRRIVPAALQMLVENALKHNVCTEARPLCIDIRTRGDHIEVANNLQVRAEVVSHQVGLANLRRQYEIHHRTISVQRSPARFTVTLPLL